MQMNLTYKLTLAAILLLVMAAPIAVTGRADGDDETTFLARLTGFGEVPPKLVDGHGKFTGTLSGNSISWTLTWTGLTGPAQVAHIHFGQPQNTGTPVVFFCGGGGRAACPGGPRHSGSNTRIQTPHQGLAPPHPTANPGGLAGFPKTCPAHLGAA